MHTPPHKLLAKFGVLYWSVLYWRSKGNGGQPLGYGPAALAASEAFKRPAGLANIPAGV